MSEILSPIERLPDVSFIDNMTLENVLTDLINNYQTKFEELTGTKITLAKADPNKLILNACAILIYQGYQYVDRAGKQDLLKYSYGPYLDNLAAMKGVTRNQAQPAKTMVRFTLSEARINATSIPVGTRVAADNIYFESQEYHEIPAGETSIDIAMVCTQSGEIGNKFLEGEIRMLVDPIAYIASAINISESSGGTEIESDESLAERIFLAPSSYSVAGPDDAYIYWAKTFNSNIADVGVSSPDSNSIDIRFILKGGVLPGETLIQGLQEYLTDKKIKPLTDQVTVSAPDIITYDIDLTYWIDLNDSNNVPAIQMKVNKAISEYIVWQNSMIGRDINPSELIKQVMTAGAKRVVVTSPVYSSVEKNIAIASVELQTVTYGGIE